MISHDSRPQHAPPEPGGNGCYPGIATTAAYFLLPIGLFFGPCIVWTAILPFTHIVCYESVLTVGLAVAGAMAGVVPSALILRSLARNSHPSSGAPGTADIDSVLRWVLVGHLPVLVLLSLPVLGYLEGLGAVLATVYVALAIVAGMGLGRQRMWGRDAVVALVWLFCVAWGVTGHAIGWELGLWCRGMEGEGYGAFLTDRALPPVMAVTAVIIAMTHAVWITIIAEKEADG